MPRSNLATIYISSDNLRDACRNPDCERETIEGRPVCLECSGTLWDDNAFVPGSTAEKALLDADKYKRVERVDISRLCRPELRLV